MRRNPFSPGLIGRVRSACADVRTTRPPLLAVWGKSDPFFLPPGAEAFKRDNPEAEVRFFDTGHFALETHAQDIGAAINDFLGRKLARKISAA